jgi:hypothetical protein
MEIKLVEKQWRFVWAVQPFAPPKCLRYACDKATPGY